MSNTSMTRFTEITQEVGTRIGYLFNDPRILWEALQAPGSIGNYFGRRRLPDGNKRLALLGDTALKLVLLREWYNGDGNRGAASDIVCQVGSNANLDRIGRENELHRYINTNRSQGALISTVTMTATVEAILGAVYLDGGIDMVERVMVRIGLKPLESEPPEDQSNSPAGTVS